MRGEALTPVPVRNTDFAHLRDGLTRTLLQRQRVQRSAGQLTPDDDTRLDSAIQVFKTVFPVGSVPKGKQLVLVRSADGFLHIEYQGKILGSVHDKWMADNVMLAYFDYISPISPAVSARYMLMLIPAEGFHRRRIRDVGEEVIQVLHAYCTNMNHSSTL